MKLPGPVTEWPRPAPAMALFIAERYKNKKDMGMPMEHLYTSLTMGPIFMLSAYNALLRVSILVLASYIEFSSPALKLKLHLKLEGKNSEGLFWWELISTYTYDFSSTEHAVKISMSGIIDITVTS